MHKRLHIWVSGRVQGVSYRASARKKALALQLVGWTRNLADGRVEILAEGDCDRLDTFLAWCRRGPLWARVDNLHVQAEPAAAEFEQFSVYPDA